MGLDGLDHLISDFASHLGWSGEAFVRLILAATCGGAVGLEREIRGRAAGFRTNLLVCVGSAIAMVVSVSFAKADWTQIAPPGFEVRLDPARIAYGVMAGIGFLGGGTILRNQDRVHGLTTAAGIWCVAAVGLAAGFGLYVISILATLLIVVALWLLDYFEDMLPKRHYRTLVLRRDWNVGCVLATIDYFTTRGVKVVDSSYQRDPAHLDRVDIRLYVGFVNSARFDEVQKQLEQDPNLLLLSTSS